MTVVYVLWGITFVLIVATVVMQIHNQIMLTRIRRRRRG